MSHAEHRASSPTRVTCAVLTISDTRTLENDTGGRTLVDLLTAAGHQIAQRTVGRDDPEAIRERIERALADPAVQVVVTTGGTGLSRRDSTFEVASAIIDKPLPGFGEIFRMLSYQEIGPAAMLSRACAGRARDKLLVCLPGSPAAVRLAVSQLLVPELGHLVREVNR
jgi:molybdenum cofactor biosynthesis protein B